LVLSALVLFCCTALPADTPPAITDTQTLVASNANAPQPVSTSKSKLPDAPAPKMADSTGADASGEGIGPGSQPFFNAPIKPAVDRPVESPRQRKIWYALVAAGSSGAALDAWTTRRAISGGYGTEGDPIMRPFAHSGVIYAATQVSPAIMDFIGRRMMTSNHSFMRRFWWVPQTAGASVSFSAGIHNYRVVH